MSGEGGFLDRWSRRKREAALARSVETAPTLEAGAEAPADGDELTPEDIAALPPLDTIGAETDITVFLRKGVPEFLRNAALRRVWAADPAIRDFVNDARDYALDWNTPGGAPGYGPLGDADDVKEMVARIFGDPEPERDSVPHEGPVRDEADPGSAAVQQASGSNNPAEVAGPPAEIAGDPEVVPLWSNDIPIIPVASTVAPQQSTDGKGEIPLRNKRHGAALPL